MGILDPWLPHAGTGIHDTRAQRDALDRAAGATPDDLGPEEFDAALTSRLVGAERLDASGRPFGYASAYAPGLLEVLALDLPSAVVLLDDEQVARRGLPVPRLLELGRVGLQRLMGTTPPVRHEVTDGGRSVHVLLGESPFTASFARFISDALTLWHPDADLSGGMVFSLPHRHAVVYQMCATEQQTRDAVEIVPAQAAAMRTDDAPDLPTDTFFWLDRHVVPLPGPGHPLPGGHRQRSAS